MRPESSQNSQNSQNVENCQKMQKRETLASSKATPLTGPVWPPKTSVTRAVCSAQMKTFPSMEPAATTFPEGSTASDVSFLNVFFRRVY